MVKDNPVIEEIRAVRHEISKACDHSPAKLVDYYIQMQRELEMRKRKRRTTVKQSRKPVSS